MINISLFQQLVFWRRFIMMNIEKLVEQEPELKVYGWEKNMCYGTKTHLDAIKENGISKYHRKTFGICREYN